MSNDISSKLAINFRQISVWYHIFCQLHNKIRSYKTLSATSINNPFPLQKKTQKKNTEKILSVSFLMKLLEKKNNFCYQPKKMKTNLKNSSLIILSCFSELCLRQSLMITTNPCNTQATILKQETLKISRVQQEISYIKHINLDFISAVNCP